jgi:uncharacterized protein YecT (DUF1311 family)
MRLLAALAVLVSLPAFAQVGPSFDCARASTAIERTICRDPELAKADREMAAAYAALVGNLTATAKDALVKDQQSWMVDRNRACTGDADSITRCLAQRYDLRTATLRAFAEGVYPSISLQLLAKRGKLGRTTWSYDIAYPRFDGTTADFSNLNARFADAARTAAADATPARDAVSTDEQEWTYEQSFAVYRPGANAVTVALQFWGYSGGAHGYGATRCTLVDLRTGRAVGPSGAFMAGEQWLRVMTQFVGADLKKQFVENPGFDDALEPAKLAKVLSEADHYCWRADKLVLIFNAYEVGPYSAGPYEVNVPYEQLKPLLRADGPIAR